MYSVHRNCRATRFSSSDQQWSLCGVACTLPGFAGLLQGALYFLTCQSRDINDAKFMGLSALAGYRGSSQMI